ncbi:hypothetical protein SAMN05421665_3509 [Yoonia rosea]|uniref:Uncharacterized protein n=1 Tax=Yoonia rosea TaxID=287098 RepID=A0A1R3XJS2_9RHOB|nr:hypothetical protein [Yoonia rosea]SIT91887.1 hypothetical protein SAMN05421665_3509 [Yoonia rosea]
MKRILLTYVFTLFATVSSAVEFDEAEVRAMCAEDWPQEQELQELCLFGERDGYDEVMVSYDDGDAMDQVLLDLCIDRSGLNWSFVADCFDEQTDAFADFPYLASRYDGRVSSSIMQDIAVGCREKWRPDLARQHFCIVRMAWSMIEAN